MTGGVHEESWDSEEPDESKIAKTGVHIPQERILIALIENTHIDCYLISNQSMPVL